MKFLGSWCTESVLSRGGFDRVSTHSSPPVRGPVSKTE